VTGRLEVLFEDDFERGRSRLLHFVEDEATGRRFRLRFEGEPPGHLKSGAIVRARGRLQGEEILMAADGDGSVGVETLAAAVEAGGTFGEQRTLVMVADFLDKNVSCTVGEVRDLVFTDPADQSIDDLYQETSSGAIRFSGSVVGPYAIDYTSDSCAFSTWGDAIDAAARADGLDPDAYTRKLYVLPRNGCPAAGIGTVGGNPSRAWVFSCELPDVFGHELGHNLGMMHAGTPSSEYGDGTDIMGIGGGPLRQVNAPHKEQMGWLLDAETQFVTQDGLYEVAPLALDPTYAVAPRALKISKPDTNESYYLSYRTAIGFDANLSYFRHLDRLSVHRYPADGSLSNTYLLALLADGESYVDEVNGLTVIQDSHNSDSATVRVQFDGGGGPTCSTSAPALSLAPASQSTEAGATLAYGVAVTNTDDTSCPATTFALDGSAPVGWGATVSPTSLSLAPGESDSATLFATSPGSAADGSYSVGVGAADTTEASHAGSASASYVVTTACAPLWPSLSVSPASQTGEPGATRGYAVTVTNADGAACGASSFALAASSPAGWSVSVAPVSLSLAPGEQGSATLSVTPPADATDGLYAVALDVWDAADPARTASQTVGYEVIAQPPGGEDLEPPTAPTGLRASPKRKQVNLAWNAATDNVGVVGYTVWRDGVAAGQTASTSFADRSFTPGATHLYTVVAHDDAGNVSPPSPAVSVTCASSAKGGRPKK
jgi:hypothetical protein